MKVYRWLQNAGKIATVITVSFGLIASPVYADSQPVYNRGSFVSDNFAKLYLKPNSKAYWYIENMGVLANGSEGRIRETYCDLQTCVKPVKDEENDDKFVRLEVHPFTLTNSQYINANLSEDVDGADGDPVYGGQTYPGAWNPTVGHPV